jgi:hypothetical protein
VLLVAGGSRLAWLLCNRRKPLDVEKIAQDIFADMAGNTTVLYECSMWLYFNRQWLKGDSKKIRKRSSPYAIDRINMYAKDSSGGHIEFALYSAPEIKNSKSVSTAKNIVEQIKKKYKRDFDIIVNSSIYS